MFATKAEQTFRMAGSKSLRFSTPLPGMWRRAHRRPAAKSRFTCRCSRAAGQDSGRSPSTRAAAPSNRVRRHRQAATRLRPRPAPSPPRSPSRDPSPSHRRPNPNPRPSRRSSNSLRPNLRASSPNHRRPIRGGPSRHASRPRPNRHHATSAPRRESRRRENPRHGSRTAAMPLGFGRRRDCRHRRRHAERSDRRDHGLPDRIRHEEHSSHWSAPLAAS